MESEHYLDRIGVDTDIRPSTTPDTLARLQRQHLLTVPFTNVHVRKGIGTTINPDTTVARIARGSGGLCYDLNGAFAWLLTELGSDVTHVSGRVSLDDGSLSPEYDHLALLVDDHVVDVGFGDFARQPLPLDGEPRTDVSGTYRIFKCDDGYAAQKRTDDDWMDVYRFTTTPRSPDEFAEMAEFHSTSPDSHFTGDLLATRATENGRLTLSGETLTITDHGTRRKQAISAERLPFVLRNRFRLSDVYGT